MRWCPGAAPDRAGSKSRSRDGEHDRGARRPCGARRPARDRADVSRAGEFAEQANANDPRIYQKANADPERWWDSWADKLEWIEPYGRVLDWSDPPWAKWFLGGTLNASVNCLDRHVAAGNGERIAFYWEGEDGESREVSYADLRDSTQRFANVLKGLGIGRGDGCSCL